MYKALFQYTFGMGVLRGELHANSCKELQEKTEAVKASIWSKPNSYIEFIVYTYPSGKSFKERVYK